MVRKGSAVKRKTRLGDKQVITIHTILEHERDPNDGSIGVSQTRSLCSLEDPATQGAHVYGLTFVLVSVAT